MNKRQVFAFLFFTFSVLYLFKPLLIGYYPDFSMHYYGTQSFLDHVSPYEGGKNFFIPHVYPPFTSLFFIPLTVFPYDTAEFIWVGLSIYMYLASVLLLFSVMNRKFYGTLELFLFGVLNFTFFPLKFTFGMGQVNTFILLCISLFFYYLSKKRNDLIAGSALAFSIGMKLFPVLFIPYLILLKKWKILFWFVLTCSLLGILSLVFFGFTIHKHFLFEVLPSLMGGWKNYYYNQSISGFVSVMMENETLRRFFHTGLSGVFLGSALYAVFRGRKFPQLAFSLLIITSLLINKFSWQHHFVLLLPSYFFLYFGTNRKWVRVLVAVSYILTAMNLKNPGAFHPILQFHVMYGAILLFGLTLYEMMQGGKRIKK